MKEAGVCGSVLLSHVLSPAQPLLSFVPGIPESKVSLICLDLYLVGKGKE